MPTLLRNILKMRNFVGIFSAPGLNESEEPHFGASARRVNLINRNIKCTQL